MLSSTRLVLVMDEQVPFSSWISHEYIPDLPYPYHTPMWWIKKCSVCHGELCVMTNTSASKLRHALKQISDKALPVYYFFILTFEFKTITFISFICVTDKEKEFLKIKRICVRSYLYCFKIYGTFLNLVKLQSSI